MWAILVTLGLLRENEVCIAKPFVLQRTTGVPGDSGLSLLFQVLIPKIFGTTVTGLRIA
jgi:hypothetical protein